MLDISELLKIAEMSGVGISHGDSGKHYILSENGEKEPFSIEMVKEKLREDKYELVFEDSLSGIDNNTINSSYNYKLNRNTKKYYGVKNEAIRYKPIRVA